MQLEAVDAVALMVKRSRPRRAEAELRFEDRCCETGLFESRAFVKDDRCAAEKLLEAQPKVEGCLVVGSSECSGHSVRKRHAGRSPELQRPELVYNICRCGSEVR